MDPLSVDDLDELQALLRYHASAIMGAIDDGGLTYSQLPRLHKTLERMTECIASMEEQWKAK